MSGAAVAWLVVYTIGFFLNIVVSGMIYDEEDEKLGARLALLTPVWPLNVVYGLYKLLMLLLEKAEIDLGKVKK